MDGVGVALRESDVDSVELTVGDGDALAVRDTEGVSDKDVVSDCEGDCVLESEAVEVSA